MPAEANDLLAKGKALIIDALDNILVIYSANGLEPFKKPLAIAGALLLALYFAVYNPLAAKIQTATNNLKNIKIVAEEAGSYRDAKNRLTEFQAKLPLLKDKEEWLSYVLMSTSKKHDIAFDGIGAQKEEPVGNFIVASRDVEFVTMYETLGKWLVDIENSPIALRVVSLTAKRDSADALKVKVSMQIATLFLKSETSGNEASK